MRFEVLQCTALTGIPEADAASLLLTMRGGPDDLSEACLDEYVLCELGEHDERVEHAVLIWCAQPPAARDLWLFWAGVGAHRIYRFARLPRCPAVMRRIPAGAVRTCRLFDRHSTPHSWDVTDPLRDVLYERDVEAERRKYEDTDHRDGDDTKQP